MAINPLSGNFQPPTQTGSGNSLPNGPTQTNGQKSESKQTVATVPAAVASQTGPTVENKPKKIDIAELNKQVEPISQNIQRGLRFQVDDITGDTVISVIDRQTDETIRQIPPEELLTLSRRLKEVSENIDSVRGILIQTDA